MLKALLLSSYNSHICVKHNRGGESMASASNDNALEEKFLLFCDFVRKGSTTATDKTIKRIFTDGGIYCKGMDPNRVDIEFRGFVGNTKRDVDFKGFVEFLEGRLAKTYAAAKGIEDQAEAAATLKSLVENAKPQLHGATKTSTDATTARLTDVKGYTGSAKERFDLSTGKGKGKAGREDPPPAFTASGISAPRK